MKIPEPSQEDAGDSSLRCLVVVSAGTISYGIEVEHVLEVVSLREITPLFKLPPHLLGVTNVRGRVLAVSDLAYFLGRTPSSASRTQGILMQSGAYEAIFTVDTVNFTTWVSLDEIEPVPATVSIENKPLFKGLLADTSPILVLDPEQLFEKDAAWFLASEKSSR